MTISNPSTLKTKARPGTVLYKYSSNKHLTTGYLFGTMHVSDPIAFTFYDLALEKLKTCDLLATEIDLDISSSYNITEMLMMQDHRLSSLYKPKRYNRMRTKLLKSFGVDIADFDQFLPIFIINLITETELMSASETALDLSIWQAAAEFKIERTGLENFEAHYQVLNKISVHEQAKQLYKLSQNLSKFRYGISRLRYFYQIGDLQMLYKLTRKSLGSMRQIMLYDRNRIIAEKIIELNDEYKLFAAMGASHLWGKFGVLAYLKKAGYKLQAIYN